MTLFGLRDFMDPGDIAGYVVNSKNFRAGEERLEGAATLLFFETRKQQTWLVATDQRVYCVLDDRRKAKPHINWAISRSKLFNADGDFILRLEVEERDRPSNISGLVHFGPKHRRWIYSKALFRSDPVDKAVERFLRGAML